MLDSLALMIGYGVLGIVLLPLMALAGFAFVVGVAALCAALWELLLAALGRLTAALRQEPPRDA
jgi:hypothetical protein